MLPTDRPPQVNRQPDQVQIGSYSFGFVWDLITSGGPRLRNVFPAFCLLKKNVEHVLGEIIR